jgi:3-oxoacyl-[acyl-carrier-protein] synthase III
VPPRLLTNADLEKMVETTDDWILQRTGIRERHIVDPGVATSDLGKETANKAIDNAGLTPADIGVVIVGTVTPDMMFPSTACLIQHKIGAHNAWGFDLSAACSAFTYSLTTACQFVSSGAHDHVLVVGADVMSSIIDYKDRATCVIFGDGAGRSWFGCAARRAADSRFRARLTWRRGALYAWRGSLHPVARHRRSASALREAGRSDGFKACGASKKSRAACWIETVSARLTSTCLFAPGQTPHHPGSQRKAWRRSTR